MATIKNLKGEEITTVRPFGKKKIGRIARIREKSRKMAELWEKAVVKPSKVDSAINLAGRDKKLIDVANYHCTKGKIKSGQVRAKERRQIGCRELVRV
ncbi:hypothetical protein BKK54_10360 [Rodentibacter genomosp. 1]|uniref:Uncharacterized protein n=1 Tax=Rodentibacter genomosp. 1 TaxID=1908264 RepID=A0A1V3J173_9PAST|nr:hypothetical protein [Rodentibacter genomosp. 1]OOF48706.1 hypothetical protein BKK54_10360 [Rodentibacter genomosp. 1]